MASALPPAISCTVSQKSSILSASFLSLILSHACVLNNRLNVYGNNFFAVGAVNKQNLNIAQICP